MNKVMVKKIKICCEMMRDYTEIDWLGVNSEGKAVFDTAMYEDNPVEIDYCPWCGEKIEYIFVTEDMDSPEEGEENGLVPEMWSQTLLDSLDNNNKLVFNKIAAFPRGEK